MYISDKGMNKSLRHQRLLYTNNTQIQTMFKNESKKKKIIKKKHDFVLLTLSVDPEASPVRRGRRSSWSPWRSMRLSATLLQNPFPFSEGVSGRPVQSQILVSLISAMSLPSCPPLVRSRVAAGGTTLMMRSHMSATVKTCWYHTLCRHHHNKARVTNSFTFWGLSGYQPWCDSLGKIKEI